MTGRHERTTSNSSIHLTIPHTPYVSYFNLILISLPKLRAKEPASRRLYIQYYCRRLWTIQKPVKRQNKSKRINFGKGTEASERFSLHERMALSRREASLGPARAQRSRGHFRTLSVRPKLPPPCVPVSPSPVSRETSRDLWSSSGPSTIVVFKQRMSVSAYPPSPKM